MASGHEYWAQNLGPRLQPCVVVLDAGSAPRTGSSQLVLRHRRGAPARKEALPGLVPAWRKVPLIPELLLVKSQSGD